MREASAAEGDASSTEEGGPMEAVLDEKDYKNPRLPLHSAVWFSRAEDLDRELRNHRTGDPNALMAVDSCKRTATDLAVITGQPETVKKLKAAGCEYMLYNFAAYGEERCTPIDVQTKSVARLLPPGLNHNDSLA